MNVLLEPMTGLEDLLPRQSWLPSDNQIQSLMVYPNPANALVTIESPVSTLERISVYSITGVLLLEKEVSANQATIDVSGFATGTYFVKATTKNASSVIQVLKN